MPRGNPEILIASARIDEQEQTIAYCVGIGYAIQAILSREQRPEDVQELLKIAAAAGAIKHIAQMQRTK